MNDLSQILRQWRDIEPAGNFEANVLRRIRLAQPAPAETFWGFWRPAWVSAAVALSIIIGSLAGLSSRPTPHYLETEFMAPTTLTGGYARLTTEARR
jgi:hypothetical protein